MFFYVLFSAQTGDIHPGPLCLVTHLMQSYTDNGMCGDVISTCLMTGCAYE